MKKLFSILLAILIAITMVACNPAAPPDEGDLPTFVDKETQAQEVAAFLYEVVEEVFPEHDVIVYVEENVAYVDLYQPGLADNLSSIIIVEQYDDWNEVVDIAAACSADLHNQLLAQNQEFSVVFSICDNVNNEAIKFISCANGEVLFDMLTEVLNSGEL